MSKANKDTAKAVLRAELKKVAERGYGAANELANSKEPIDLSVRNEFGEFQIKVTADKSQQTSVISLLASIDGPGVPHLWKLTSSVTDICHIEPDDEFSFVEG